MAPLSKKELVERLINAEDKLGQPSKSKDALIYTLGEVEDCLHMMGQSHSQLLQAANFPLVMSLDKHEWVKHTENEVRLMVTSCLSEILSISAPKAPYSDDALRKIMQLLVHSFKGLGKISSSHFARRVTILELFAKVRMENIMLDLNMDRLIYKMFHHFIAIARKEHAESVIAAMRDIMISIINQCEESDKFFQPLISMLMDVWRHYLIASPTTHDLVNSVVQECEKKLQPFLVIDEHRKEEELKSENSHEGNDITYEKMADIVQYKLEHMIPELDDLEKRGLFSKAEIKDIVKKRRDFEYKLKRPSPLREDYLRYIQYEKQLEALRCLRKKEIVRGLKENNKRWHFSLCDKASARRILDIYRRLLTRNKGNLKLWFEYAEFCREQKGAHMKKVLGKALNFHPNVPGLWIYAAAWEFEFNLNVNAARALMLSGLRACPKSEILWLEYFRMELIFVSKLRARKIALGLDSVSSLRDDEEKDAWKKENSDLFMSLNEEKPDDGGEIFEIATNESEKDPHVLAIRELGFKMAYIIFDKAVEAIPSSLRFRQQLVEILDSVDVERANVLEDEMCKRMQKDFANDESCWDWLARRHISKCQRNKQINKNNIVAALNKAIQVYEEGTSTIITAKMFGYYAKFLQELIDYDKCEISECLALFRSCVSNVEEITTNLIKLYETAECKGCLNEDLAEQHISFLLKVGDADTAKKLAAKFCIGAFSKSAKIWLLRMSLEIKSVMMNSSAGSKADLQSLFELFTHVLGRTPISEAHDLWHMAMELFSSQRDYFDQIVNMLSNVLSGGGGGNEGAFIASTVLDWFLQNQGVKSARYLYNNLLASPGPSLDFYIHCIKFESQLAAVGCEEARKNMRKLYDSALKIYNQNIELWLDYCSEELKAGKSDLASSVYWRARKTLKDPSAFIEAYQLLTS